MALLEVQRLTHLYGQGTPFETSAIEDVTFSVEPGEIIGIIGHTGSGKSTLMQHFNGLLKPDFGKVLIDGEDIWAEPKNIRKYRFMVGLVFQYPEHQLFDETVYKDIAFGPKNMGLNEREIDESVQYAANLVGLQPALLEKSPFDLSGGEMRRAAIAGVIAMKPKILVLDEPTAGLDPAGRELIMSRIKEYRDETGAAVLIASHSMEDIAAVSDKVLVMNAGRMAMFDEAHKVFSEQSGLSKIGLNLPEITKIMIEVKKRGIDVNPNCLTVEEALKEIARFRKERGNFRA